MQEDENNGSTDYKELLQLGHLNCPRRVLNPRRHHCNPREYIVYTGKNLDLINFCPQIVSGVVKCRQAESPQVGIGSCKMPTYGDWSMMTQVNDDWVMMTAQAWARARMTTSKQTTLVNVDCGRTAFRSEDILQSLQALLKPYWFHKPRSRNLRNWFDQKQERYVLVYKFLLKTFCEQLSFAWRIDRLNPKPRFVRHKSHFARGAWKTQATTKTS